VLKVLVMVQVSGFVFEMGWVSKTISWVCSEIVYEKREGLGGVVFLAHDVCKSATISQH